MRGFSYGNPSSNIFNEYGNVAFPNKTYEIYFGLGHSVRLTHGPEVFAVSPAGIALGSYLMKFMRPKDLAGEILDMGTGSGVFPFLLRKMGANHITATDVCPHAIQSALKNERLEFEKLQTDATPYLPDETL